MAIFAIALPTMAAWYLGATIYFVWHDRLLASLMARQTDMQYAYEDRIAAMGDDLARETTRGGAERAALDANLRDLAERGDRLMARAAEIDGMVARLGVSVPSATGPRPTPRGDTDTSSDALRLDHGLDAGPLDGEAGADANRTVSPRAKAETIARDFARLEAGQARLVAALATPTLRTVEHMHRALAKTGLSLDRWHLSRGVGGPFVALPASDRSFDQSLALLRDASRQKARLAEIIASVPLRKPVAGPLDVTSSFGARLDPFYGRPAMHTGVDLREDFGEAVTATAGGTVTLAGPDGGYGTMVEIDHGGGIRTRYAHLASVAVAVDQKVAAGTVVGQVGATGRATGPHLHYEVRIDGDPVDPVRFLAAGDGLFGAT